MSEEMQEQIKQMLDSGSGEVYEEESHEYDEPKSEVVEEDVKEEGEEVVEETTNDEVDDEVKEEEVDPLAELRASIEELKKQNEELKTQLTTKKEEPKEEVEVEPEVMDFVGDTNLEYLSKDQLNTLLNTVYKKGIESTRKSVTEEVLRRIPEVVKRNVEVASALKATADKFYSDNPDLQPFKKAVATVYEEISSANPDKTFADIVDEVAKESRKRLGLNKKVNKPTPQKPTLAPGNSGKHRKAQEKVSPLLDEIDKMNFIGD